MSPKKELILRSPLIGRHTQRKILQCLLKAAPTQTFIVDIFIKILFVSTPRGICHGCQRHVVQCIHLPLQVGQVGFCADEYNMQSSCRDHLLLSVRQWMNLEIFGVGLSYSAFCSVSAVYEQTLNFFQGHWELFASGKQML